MSSSAAKRVNGWKCAALMKRCAQWQTVAWGKSHAKSVSSHKGYLGLPAGASITRMVWYDGTTAFRSTFQRRFYIEHHKREATWRRRTEGDKAAHEGQQGIQDRKSTR